jgi:hypothetical protein
MNRWYCPIKLFDYFEDRIRVRVSRLSAKNFPGGPEAKPDRPFLKRRANAILINPLYLAPESAHAFPFAPLLDRKT